jgi:hypothetical protein
MERFEMAELMKRLIGAPAEDAKRLVEEAGAQWQDVSDPAKPVSLDIRPMRIRVRIVDGVVAEASNGWGMSYPE